jgi:hypothetical protein
MDEFLNTLEVRGHLLNAVYDGGKCDEKTLQDLATVSPAAPYGGFQEPAKPQYCNDKVVTGYTEIMKSLTMGVYMAYRQPTASLTAHMTGMVMGDMLVGLGTRLRPRAHAPGLDYAPREPSRRYASMAQLEPIRASVCAYGTGIRMSVHP